MKTIIAGGREHTDPQIVSRAVEASGWYWEISEVVSGRARGIDSFGERWGRAAGKKVVFFPADWDRYGKSAGSIRNQAMADYADALIAIPGKGPGTYDMIMRAEKTGLKVFVYREE